MEKVIALIVTYNRKQLLADCITALRNQTRKPNAILVVNNNSTDGTEEWLKTQNDITVLSQSNNGSAGGFNAGLKWAYKNGYSWVWCMDDDGYPKEDALENILKYDDGSLKLLNCAVLDKEDKSSFVWKTGIYTNINQVKENCIDGICHPFNGTLIHRRIIERVGLPKTNFFLWGDETEYFYRILKTNKIPACTIANSVHYHPRTCFSVKKDWAFLTNWKMYFYVRNRFPVLQAKLNNKSLAFAYYLVFLAAFAAVILIFQKTDKLKKLQAMVQPAMDALFQKFSTTPALVTYKLEQIQQKQYYFQKFWDNLSKSLQPPSIPTVSLTNAE